MKYSAVLALVLASSVSAFAPTFSAGRSASLLRDGPVDKTMNGIYAEGSFDPTTGDNPALARNNKGEVWNQQVSYLSSDQSML